MNKKNPILDLSFEFALRMIDFSEQIKKLGHFHLSSQIFRSGTSIGANVREAQNPESKKDFIHKIKVAAKEAHEVEYWLLLCKESKSLISPIEDDFKVLHQIKLLLFKILSTSIKNLK